MVVLQAFVCWFTWFWFDVVGVGCVDFSFVAAALVVVVVAFFLGFSCWFLVGLVGECGGVVCELDSVFVFCFYACFLFLSIFLVGIACHFCGGFSGLNVYMFCSESLILAQDERWRRA